MKTRSSPRGGGASTPPVARKSKTATPASSRDKGKGKAVASAASSAEVHAPKQRKRSEENVEQTEEEVDDEEQDEDQAGPSTAPAPQSRRSSRRLAVITPETKTISKKKAKSPLVHKSRDKAATVSPKKQKVVVNDDVWAVELDGENGDDVVVVNKKKRGRKPKPKTAEKVDEDKEKQPKKAEKKEPKFVIISDDEDDEDDEDLLEDDTDSGDDYKEGKAFDPVEVAKSFVRSKKHYKEEDDEGDEEDEDGDNEEGEGSGNDEDGESAPKRRRGVKKEKKPKAATGGKSAKSVAALAALRKKNIEQREDLPLPVAVTNESHTPDTSCCLLCSSREFMRAIENKDMDLLKALLEKPEVGTWCFGNSPDHPLSNPLSLAVAKDQDELIHVLMTRTATYKNVDPPSSYVYSSSSTGRANYRTYGRAIKKVNESRGNREGNNAFYGVTDSSPYDFDKRGTPIRGERSVEGSWCHAMRAACRLPYSEKTFERLSLSCPSDAQAEFGQWALYEAVSAGNRKLASKMLEMMRDYAGFFNTLHHETLSLEPGTPFTAFRQVSVLKKANSESHSIKPLHFSAINPDADRLQTLLDAISPANALDADAMGRTVVHFAAVCEGTGPLKLLLEKGFEIKGVDASKMSPLLLAAKYGRSENVKIIIDAMGGGSAAADSTFLPSGYTALHFAAGHGHLEVVQTLIDAHATIDAIDKNGKLTPLIHACRTGQLEVVKLLLSKGANIFAADNMGRTPLIHAVKNGHFELVVTLLAEGADASASDTSDNSPLHYACGFGWRDIAKVLLDYGQAELNALNSWKCTPLMIADMKGHFGLTQYLLELPGIEVNFLDKDGFSMVHLMFNTEMTSRQDVDMRIKKLETLLKHGADPNVKSVEGETALHMLMNWTFDASFSLDDVSSYQVKVLELLIENGALLEERNGEEETPLLVAVKNVHLALVVELLKAGALIKNANASGKSFMQQVFIALATVDAHKFVERDLTDFQKSFEKVSAESKVMAEQADALLALLKSDYSDVIEPQLNEVDSEGYTPLLRGLKDALDKQTVAIPKLEQRCRNQTFYSWNRDNIVLFTVNLDSSFGSWLNGVKHLRDLGSFLNCKVEIPANFKKEKPTDPNPEFTGYSLLHFAAKTWNADLVKALAEWGAPLNGQDDNGATPLSLALEKLGSTGEKSDADKCKFEQRSDLVKQVETVKILLARGANPSINDKQFESSLFRAVSNLPEERFFASIPKQQQEMVLALVESSEKFSGTPLDVLSKKESKTVCMLAFEKGYDNFAAVFAKAGASMDVIGPKSVSTALLAIKQGRLSAAQVIVSADLSIADETGQTCAMEACNQSDEIARLILETDGLLNINSINKAHETALIVATKKGRSVEVLTKILNNGADVNYSGPDGKSALVWAIETNRLESVKLLLQNKANVNVQVNMGQWALHFAVLSRNNKIVTILLENGANPDVVRTKDKATPLHVAVEESKKEVNKSLKIERSLLQFGASLNPIDAQGRTPLHIAFFGLGKIPVMDLTSNELKVRKEYEDQLALYNSGRERVKEYVKKVIGATSDTDKANIFKWFYDTKIALPENSLKPVEDKRSTAEEYALGVMNSGQAEKNDPVEIVDFLATLPEIQSDVVDKFGRTPLHYAALIGASSCTNALLKSGVNLDRPDKDGNTPLQLSLLGEHVDFYLNLGLQGAKVNGHLVLADGTTESNFFYALMKGFMSIGYFIKNREHQNLCTAISDALRTGRYSLALSMASTASALDLQSVDSQSRTLLHVIGDFKALNASIWEEEYVSEMFDVLKKVNLDINAVDKAGRTPLICAAKHRQEAVVDLLLSVPGVFLDVSDESGATAVLNAVLSKSKRLISSLLAKGAKVDHPNTKKQVSVLRAAVDSGSEEILTLVLEAGALLDNEEPTNRMTPLLKAIHQKADALVSKLIAAGVNLNRRSIYELTGKDGKKEKVQMPPVILAYASPKIFKILVAAGVDVNAKHPLTGRSCLMEAMDKSSKEDIILLLNNGADVNVVDAKHEQTSFQWGVLQSISPFKELSPDFAQYKPDVSSANTKTGWTLLDHAINKSDNAMIKKLLALGANPNSRSLPSVNPNSMTSLMFAIQANKANTVKTLIEESQPSSRVDLDATDNRGRNAIHYIVCPYDGASFENVDLLKYLHQRGSSIDLQDRSGHRPIDYTSQSASRTLADALRELGSPPASVADAQSDETMRDVIEPFSNIEADAILERARLELVSEKEEEDKLHKEAEKRKVDVNVIRTERKKKEWIKVNPSADVDPLQVRVLFEGDGIEEYKPYNVLLHKCDVSRGIYGENKFYIMQILYNHLQDIHFLFNKWGDSSILRTNGRNYDYGQFQKTPFNTKEECIKEFKKVFKSKTGNEWDSDFVEKPGKYALVKTNKKRSITVKPIDYNGVPASTLPSTVGEVLRMFLHVASLKSSGSSSDLALPFDGVLDAGVVNSAYDILLTIRQTFKEMDAKTKDTTTIPSAKELLALREKLVILSTDYYRLLPTREGQKGLKPILTAEDLSTEMIRVNNLRYYDTSLMLMFAANHNRLIHNPVDYTCAALKSHISPLLDGHEKDLIKKWIAQSNKEGIDILNILKVDRDGEAEAFEGHHGNKKLLFHGSKMSNMLGILKHGLQVAPVEAPVSGYMFGKGIYFADVFAKSWGYVHDHIGTDDTRAYGCMFICEVALGETHDLEESDSTLETAKPGTSSTKGLGRNVPAPEGDITLLNENIKLPLGSLSTAPLRKDPETNKEIERVLNYNEYIVYNPAQVKIKYLLVLRDSTMCHLCSSEDGLKPCSEYSATYERYSDLPKKLAFESEIVSVLLQKNGLSGKDLWNRDLEAKIIGKKLFEKRWKPSTSLTLDAKICKCCADWMMTDLMEEYFEENRGLVLEDLLNRENCWYGRECTTQAEDSSHAQKYNHFCDKKVQEKAIEETEKTEEENESEDGSEEDDEDDEDGSEMDEDE